MVAHAANKNNSRSKKMKTIDKDAASVPDNPIEEGIGMTLPHKGSATSYGEISATVSEEQLSKKEIAGTSHKAGNSMDLGATPPLQKQTKMKEEPSETMSADEALITKSTPWCIV